MSAAIFGTGAKWHLCVSSWRLTVWLITLCVVFFQHNMCWGDQPVELWLLTLDLLRCLGLELYSFSALLSCLAFDCGMSCMNLSLLVKVWVLLNFSQSLSFTRLTAHCFFLLFDYFSFIFPFPGILDSMGVLWTHRLFAFTHVVFGLVFLGGVLVGSHVCFFRHGVRHLRLAMQYRLVRKLWFHLLE